MNAEERNAEKNKELAQRKRASRSPSARPTDAQLALDEIQKRLDALAAAMVGKALKTPSAEFCLKSLADCSVSLHWATPKSGYNDDYKYFYGTAAEALGLAAAYVTALPSPEQARMTAFMGALGEAIELGKKADIDVEYVNPLLALMKTLSKNALEHQVSA